MNPAVRSSLARTTVGALASTAGLLAVALALLVSSAHVPGPAGWSPDDVRAWIDAQPIGVTFHAVAAVGVVVVLYRVVSTWALWLGEAAAATNRRHLARLARSMTSGRVRRVLAAVVGLTLSTATTTAGASARSPSPAATVTTDRSSTATMRLVGQPSEETIKPPSIATWTIAPGDHLWGLARAALVEQGAVTDDRRVAAYVEAIVERNHHRLVVPGNPDLIFPGQVFERPPID